MTRVERNIGANRGNPRIWLEGKFLLNEGWTRGTEYRCRFEDGWIVYDKSLDSEGRLRKVAGTNLRPIIDTNSKKITESFGDAERVLVCVTYHNISIRPL